MSVQRTSALRPRSKPVHNWSPSNALSNGPAANRVGAYGFVPKDKLPGGMLRQLIEKD